MRLLGFILRNKDSMEALVAQNVVLTFIVKNWAFWSQPEAGDVKKFNSVNWNSFRAWRRISKLTFKILYFKFKIKFKLPSPELHRSWLQSVQNDGRISTSPGGHRTVHRALLNPVQRRAAQFGEFALQVWIHSIVDCPLLAVLWWTSRSTVSSEGAERGQKPTAALLAGPVGSGVLAIPDGIAKAENRTICQL